MKRVKTHVNRLFSGYKETEQLKELKAELISNLEAKVADLTAGGMSRKEAETRAIQDVSSVDEFLESHRRVYDGKFKLELCEAALIYTLLAWIMTIPLQLIGVGVLLNTLLLAGAVVLGITRIVLHYTIGRSAEALSRVKLYHLKGLLRYRVWAWRLWAVFIVVSIGWVTAQLFASNIWFGRMPDLQGPYQFAVTFSHYIIPFISIFVPLLVGSASGLLQKHAAGEV